jgi:pyruvate formate lyase activating enzyme
LLERRSGLLDGIVFSGGEPTRQDLRAAIEQVKDMGFAVGLHTMGAYPKRLARVLPLVDWVGFDVKAEPERLESICRTPGAAQAMTRSLDLLLSSGVDYQIRTTWGPGVQSYSEAQATRAWATARGAVHPVLQAVRIEGTRPDFRAAYAAQAAGG